MMMEGELTVASVAWVLTVLISELGETQSYTAVEMECVTCGTIMTADGNHDACRSYCQALCNRSALRAPTLQTLIP